MKMNSWKVLLVLIAVLSVILAASYLHSGPYIRARFASQLDKILPPEDCADFNFSRTILEISRLFDPDADVDGIDAELKKWADEIKAETSSEAEDEAIIGKFNALIFQRENFHYNEEVIRRTRERSPGSPEFELDLRLVNRVFKRRSGVCSGLSYICLMVAEKAGLPLCAVGMPGHIFVRYSLPDREPINIEATNNGAEVYDYEKLYNPVCRGDSKFYGNCMTKKAALGIYLAELGYIFRAMKNFNKSDILFKKALEYCPLDPDMYWDNAEILWRGGDYAHAQQLIEKALVIDPEDSGLNGVLGWLYYCQGRKLKAEFYLNKALRIDPDNTTAKKWMEKLGNAGPLSN
jgi:tetratricopeptide (TPR) repeat protein